MKLSLLFHRQQGGDKPSGDIQSGNNQSQGHTESFLKQVEINSVRLGASYAQVTYRLSLRRTVSILPGRCRKKRQAGESPGKQASVWERRCYEGAEGDDRNTFAGSTLPGGGL